MSKTFLRIACFVVCLATLVSVIYIFAMFDYATRIAEQQVGGHYSGVYADEDRKVPVDVPYPGE